MECIKTKWFSSRRCCQVLLNRVSSGICVYDGLAFCAHVIWAASFFPLPLRWNSLIMEQEEPWVLIIMMNESNRCGRERGKKKERRRYSASLAGLFLSLVTRFVHLTRKLIESKTTHRPARVQLLFNHSAPFHRWNRIKICRTSCNPCLIDYACQIVGHKGYSILALSPSSFILFRRTRVDRYHLEDVREENRTYLGIILTIYSLRK